MAKFKLRFTRVPTYVTRFENWKAYYLQKRKKDKSLPTLTSLYKTHKLPLGTIHGLLRLYQLPNKEMARKIEAVTDGNVKAIDTLLEAENIRILSKKISDELRYLKYSSKKIKSSELYKIRLNDFKKFIKNVPDACNAKNKNTIRQRLNNQIVTKGAKC